MGYDDEITRLAGLETIVVPELEAIIRALVTANETRDGAVMLVAHVLDVAHAERLASVLDSTDVT